MADWRDSVIEQLADERAALLEERDAFRLVSVEAIHLLHAMHVAHVRLAGAHRRLIAEFRELRAHEMHKAAAA